METKTKTVTMYAIQYRGPDTKGWWFVESCQEGDGAIPVKPWEIKSPRWVYPGKDQAVRQAKAFARDAYDDTEWRVLPVELQP